jgi:hypothetical protein
MSTCVIVAGTYRSGTSLLSRFLHESGVDMNPAATNKDLPGWHPTGSYKDAILECGEFKGWESYFNNRNVSNVWGIKSHNLLFAPKMLEDFLASCPAERCVLVWTMRNQLDAAKSWKSFRPDLSIEAATEKIGDQIGVINKMFEGWQEADKIVVNFPDTVTNAQEQLTSITNLIGIPFSIEACAHIRADIPRWS